MINNHDNDEIESCCSKSRFYFVKFIVMVVISIIIMAFSMYQIITNPDDNNSVYFSLISSIFFTFVPTPSARP